MTSSMRGFALDIESRLEKSYKDGAGKKFGISDVASESARTNAKSEASIPGGKEVKDLDLRSEVSSTLSKMAGNHKKTKSGSSALKPKMPKVPKENE